MSKSSGAPSSAAEAVRPSLEAVCAALAKAHPGREGALANQLARLLHQRLPSSYRIRVAEADLPDALLESVRFLDKKRAEELRVEVRPGRDLGPRVAPYTVVRVTLRDQYFLFDTVRETIRQRGFEIAQLYHPVLAIKRDESGALLEIKDGAESTPEHVLESFMHFEIQALDEATRVDLQSRVAKNLRDAVRVVTDFARMKERLAEARAMLQADAQRLPELREELLEGVEFLQWIEKDHFIFLGYRAYDIQSYPELGGRKGVAVRPGSGLGLLGDEGVSNYAKPVLLEELPRAVSERLHRRVCPLISKANSHSTVHRHAQMDYIGLKRLDARGEVIGEIRFLGLFTSKAFAENATQIPVLRKKLEKVVKSVGMLPGSHDAKEVVSLFARLPKSELFLMNPEEIRRTIGTILEAPSEDRVRVTLRRDGLDRGLSVMVILPRERFDNEASRAIQQVVSEACGSKPMDVRVVLGEEPTVRLHYYFTMKDEPVAIDAAALELEIANLTRSWNDQLIEALQRRGDFDRADQLWKRWRDAFSADYKAIIPAERAAEDIEALEETLKDQQPRVRVDQGPAHRGTATTLLLIYRAGARFELSGTMPWLDNLALNVINELSFGLEGRSVPRCYVHSFRVQDERGNFLAPPVARGLRDLISLALAGEIENDALNGLIVNAALDWREVDLLRTYRNYILQVRRDLSLPSIHDALLRNGPAVNALVQYFHARFDPASLGGLPGAQRLQGALPERRAALMQQLEAISDVRDYRIFARFLNAIDSTLRTNFYQTLKGERRIAIKIECAKVDDMPAPRPLYEIYIHATYMEGVHLRSGPVARGGIRWSDRKDDFRTEVLGLMKTQRTKNAVIVPVGSKGGFITKRQHAEREAHLKEGIDRYRTFISGLLDITDNIVDGKVVHPERCVRYDGEDPYLVVAADKGTATYSDFANALSLERGFWLGDAFASGGSQGYDHKKEGITARGGWECVKRHFREMNIDIQKTPFTVVGIGDMSGDVFGNGMLLAQTIKLRAAFDHRDIFLDPNPDPATSFLERKRMFALPRSSWADYRKDLISAGGGIFSRKLRKIPLSPEVRAMLDVSDAEMAPEDLIRAILKMPCDLLWNGGIGTYVKAGTETHADVRDEATDALRVDSRQLRCKVVGEGGNLGFTQRARIEFAAAGGRINTDAIDNSAGVDLSDHEVNLKILLAPVVQEGRLTIEQRNDLLRSLTDEVCLLVLEDNYRQSLVLSMDRQRSLEDLSPYRALMERLVTNGLLDRAVEFLPSRDELEARAARNEGLTRPEIAVLLAYSKIDLFREILDSDVADDAALRPLLHAYFPNEIQKSYAADIDRHRLRREIAATMLTNRIVDRVGVAWPARVASMLGCNLAQLARAFLVADALLGTPALAAEIDQLDGRVPTDAQIIAYRMVATAQERLIPSILRWLDSGLSIQQAIEKHRSDVAALKTRAAETPVEWRRRDSEELYSRLVSRGFPEEFAERLGSLHHLARAGEITGIASEAKCELLRAMEVYYRTGTALEFAEALREAKAGNEKADEERQARSILTEMLRTTYRTTVVAILKHHAAEDVRAAVERWAAAHAQDLEMIRGMLEKARTSGALSLGTLFILNDRFSKLAQVRA
ncbi:MAG: NAD-glutamate dehydrogenase [Planctomycetes bacterium]|nr:NAD-glutamate dehydrogenase [Planctomycetota bacterium]